jgi:uncharacterized repeat protein (TIGR01451 family)
MVSLNGIGPGGGANDTVELWQNTSPADVAWDPVFNDPAETQLLSLDYTTGGSGTWPYSPALAAYQLADSTLGGDADYLVFWMIPIQALIDEGVISDYTDLANTLFFLATSANANNYNKDILDCPFGPQASLTIDKTVSPSEFAYGYTGPVVYSIVVTNPSQHTAVGVKVEDDDFAACLTISGVTVTPSTGATLVSSDPLEVAVDSLAANGGQVTVEVTAYGSTCSQGSYVNNAETFATNAALVTDPATLTVLATTAVDLASFTATGAGDAVRVAWRTATEIDNLGFNLYRADWIDAPRTKLNAALIPGQAPGSPVGGSYQFVDGVVQPGARYYYWLEDVDLYGRATLHGPITAKLGFRDIQLPFFGR